jgi:hypothetical protein
MPKTRRPTWPEVEEAADEVVEEAEEVVEEEPAAQPAEETGEEIQLRVLAGNVGQELALTQAAAERYMEQNPNIIVEVSTPRLRSGSPWRLPAAL